jgi:hypothetical protein
MGLSSNALTSTLAPHVGSGPAGQDAGEGAREEGRRRVKLSRRSFDHPVGAGRAESRDRAKGGEAEQAVKTKGIAPLTDLARDRFGVAAAHFSGIE